MELPAEFPDDEKLHISPHPVFALVKVLLLLLSKENFDFMQRYLSWFFLRLLILADFSAQAITAFKTSCSGQNKAVPLPVTLGKTVFCAVYAGYAFILCLAFKNRIRCFYRNGCHSLFLTKSGICKLESPPSGFQAPGIAVDHIVKCQS